MSFHFVVLLLGLFTLAGTLISLRREHIRTEYSVSWLLVGLILTGLGAFPGLLDAASHWLGLSREGSFLIIAGTLVTALVFEISHVVSRLRDENALMAQKIAALEYQLHKLGKQDES